LAISRHVLRSTWRGAAIWGVVFGLWVVSTVEAFLKGYPTLAERRQLAQSLQSFQMILGVPHHADTVAGFTSWRVSLAIIVIGAIWGLLTGTGTLRGQEEAGQWELLLSGPTTKRRAVVQALLGFGGALLAMFIPTVLLILASGNLPGAHFTPLGSLLFATSLVLGAGVFLAVGALTSQLAATRSQAATIAAVVLGVSYLIRMVADSRSSLGWLRWLTPLGWGENLRPLQDAQPIALAPMVGSIGACAILAVWLAGRRDLGASVLRQNERRSGSGRFLLGPLTLALRMSRTSGLAWLGGAAVTGYVYGSLTRSSAAILTSSPAITAALGRLGVKQASEGYLGVVFLIVDVFIAIVAATQVSAIRGEEATGRLDYLLVRPVRRRTWLAGRVAVSLVLLLLTGQVAGFFTWFGAESQHAGVGLGKLLEAGFNATIPSLFVLGAGVLVFGLLPRRAVIAAYGIVAWSFLVDLLGSLLKGSEWLKDSSLFSHIALAPAAKPDWGAVAVIAGLALAAAAVGVLAFQRRDIEYL
jgi:ABC-2 type transport system permease protein